MVSFSLGFLVTLLIAGISGFIGWHARTWLGLPSELEKTLSADLLATNNKLKNYQLDVHHHFEKTADLFNQMLRQSKNLHEYLLTSSKELCHSDATISSTNIVNSDPNHWQEIVIKSYNNKPDTSKLDHNWHPTYFEARDASSFKTKQATKMSDSLNLDSDHTENYYNDNTNSIDPNTNATPEKHDALKKAELAESEQ